MGFNGRRLHGGHKTNIRLFKDIYTKYKGSAQSITSIVPGTYKCLLSIKYYEVLK